jgi:predicted alpha/beta hydrolase family esterase
MQAPGHLILHGWQGSGLDHWQTWLARRLKGAAYPALPDPDLPHLEPWLDALHAELARLHEPVVLCHSLGCVLWLHHAATRPADGPRASRVLLVAPPCACCHVPEIAEFFPVPRDPADVAAAAEETRLVCSDGDPYCPEGAVVAYGRRLEIPIDIIPGAGHLNPESGYGPWPVVEAWARGERSAVA